MGRRWSVHDLRSPNSSTSYVYEVCVWNCSNSSYFVASTFIGFPLRGPPGKRLSSVHQYGEERNTQAKWPLVLRTGFHPSYNPTKVRNWVFRRGRSMLFHKLNGTLRCDSHIDASLEANGHTWTALGLVTWNRLFVCPQFYWMDQLATRIHLPTHQVPEDENSLRCEFTRNKCTRGTRNIPEVRSSTPTSTTNSRRQV